MTKFSFQWTACSNFKAGDIVTLIYRENIQYSVVSHWEENGKPLQYSCLENPMNSKKRQKDRTLKDELPRFVGTQYTTGDQWRLYFFGSKITADGEWRHEIKGHLLLGRKVMDKLDSILKIRDITLPTKVHLVKTMVYPIVMYGC